MNQLLASNWFTGPDFLWKSELPRGGGGSRFNRLNLDLSVQVQQVLNTKMKDERSLLDRLTKFSDWKRAVKAIARLKRHAKQIKGYKLKESEATSIEEK